MNVTLNSVHMKRLGVAATAMAFGLVLAGASSPAQAVTVPFAFDAESSSVQVTKTGSNLLCSLSKCGVSASIVQTPSSMNIGTGDTWTFDFIQWETKGLGSGKFDVTANLAFNPPQGTAVSGSGGGSFFTIAGLLTGGTLTWDNMPIDFKVGSSTFSASFEGGKDIFKGSKTTRASVTGVNVVPLPAAAWLLLGGLASLGLLGRRQRKAVA